jgi:hypothetical protein
MGEVSVIAVSITDGVCFCDDGEAFPINTMLDEDGDETSDINEVVVIVGQMASGMWVTIDMREFQDAVLN